MKNLVSVIIPIYNVEEYLEKCLDSVINQTYTSLEIICVNDCSPDNSAKILQDYARKDDRIKIVNHEKNGGISAARNSGLDVAAGEYIYFIDSDDWIDLDYIEKMVEAIEKNNTDIVLNTNIQSVLDDSITPFVWKRYSKNLPEGEFLETTDAINLSQIMIWAHLYKKSFLDRYHLRFPEGYLLHEDNYFHHISKIKCEKIFCFYGGSYYYRQRQGSLISSRKSKVIPVAKILNLILDFYQQNDYLLKYRIRFAYLCFSLLPANHEEFEVAQKIARRILFEKQYIYLTDFEKFALQLIDKSVSFQEASEKNIRFAYMRKRMKQQFKVSIIIPVYNSGKYLRKCLDSVCCQTLQDIEIICVNDCSSDNSLDILQEYAQFDNRIKIINFEQNKGVSAARNAGLEIAKGEYLGFVDSDDYIDLDFYEKLYHKAQDEKSDIAKAVKCEILDSGENKIVDINSGVKENKFNFLSEWVTAIYKNTLIQTNKIKFLVGIQCTEDIVFLVHCVLKANKVSVIDHVHYYYCRHSNSLNSKERKQELLFHSISADNEILNLLINAPESEISEREYGTLIVRFLLHILEKIFLLENLSEKQKNIILFLKKIHEEKVSYLVEKNTILKKFLRFLPDDEEQFFLYIKKFKDFNTFKFLCIMPELKKV